MEAREKAAFISAYTTILTKAWSDESFGERLEAAPRTVLAEVGLELPASATVLIVRSLNGDPDLDGQVALWEEGKASGSYQLHVPVAPQIETKELSESDLAAVSGGDVSICCCCCPCCCCT